MIIEPEVDADEAISDLTLCDAIRGGEAWPLALLWKRHHTVALRWARSKDATNAEDVVSEAFESVFRALMAGGGPTGSFRGYLFRTISSHGSQLWAAAQRTQGFGDLSDLDDFDVAAPSPGILLSESEEQSAAAAALDDLPMRWKHVILAVDVGGRTVQDVATELDLSPNSTSVLLKRARQGLRKSWLKHMHPPRGLRSDCSECVSQFGEIRWGKRNRRSRVQAEEHLGDCPGCRSRWTRFAEQAAVIGMASTGVIVMNRDWRRKSAIAAVASVASVGIASTVLAVVAPAIAPPPNIPSAPPLTAHESDAHTGQPDSGGVTGQVRDSSEGRQGNPEVTGETSLETQAGPRSGTDELATEVPTGAEFVNSAHVNVNDVDTDGDGTPGSPTNEVWSRWGGVTAIKVDASDSDLGLGGARFRVWASSQPSGCLANADLMLVTDPNGEEFSVESSEDGAISVPALWVGDDEANGGEMNSGLSQRCYVLEEIAAPEGYELPRDSAARTELIAKSMLDPRGEKPVMIPNQRSGPSVLSLTGSGAPFLLLGAFAILMSVAGAILANRRFGYTRH